MRNDIAGQTTQEEEKPPVSGAGREAGISVALSGGGHRAALFCLGALLYLVDSQQSEHVGSIASVSGGSLTNGVVAQGVSFHEVQPATFRDHVRPFVRRLADTGTFQGRRLTPAWRNTAAVILILAFGVFAIPGPTRLTRYAVFLGAIVVWSAIFVGPLFGTRFARFYGALFACTLVIAVTTWWILPLRYAGNRRWWEVAVQAASSPLGRLGLFVLSLAAWAWLVAAQRGRVCTTAYRETLAGVDGAVTKLRQITAKSKDVDGVDHIFCATDLQSAEHIYFGREFIYGYRFGKGHPRELSLADAVQASANLPFAFPPKRIDAQDFDFAYQDPKDECPRPEDRPAEYPPRNLLLTDGGVYDNMADQWAQGFRNRKDCWPTIADERNEPTELIVVNASAGLEWEKAHGLGVPLVGEVVGLLKIKDVLYDQTTAYRRLAMVTAFDAATLSGKGLRGALVNISQNPFGTPEHFAREHVRKLWPDRGDRADRVLKLLRTHGETSQAWKAQAAHDAAVPTVLRAMGAAETADLLRHGYLLALANLHVVLDYPLPTDLPPIEHFLSLCGAPVSGNQHWEFVRAIEGQIA